MPYETEEVMQELLAKLDAIQRSHTVAADFEKTLALLAALKAGAVCLEQVNLTPGGWSIAQEKPEVDAAVKERFEEMLASRNGKNIERELG